MAVPNLSNATPGVYVGAIEGQSSFEPAAHNGYTFGRAFNTQSKFFLVSGSGNSYSVTDMYTRAYMPTSISTNSWFTSSRKSDVRSKFKLDFSETFDWSSGREGGSWIRHSKFSSNSSTSPSYDYPVVLARTGYRTMTISSYYSLTYTNGNPCIRNYYVFANRVITAIPRTNTTTTITLTSSSYRASGAVSYSGSWNRRWVGLSLQAGGEAGADKSGWGNGSGGSAGGYWVGLIELSSTVTITIAGYDAESGGRDGSTITVKRGGNTLITVNGGGGEGGEVLYSYTSGLIAFRSAKGGTGGGGTGGSGASISSWPAETSDQESIPFINTIGGENPNGAGGGGGSVYCSGGSGGGHAVDFGFGGDGDNGEDRGEGWSYPGGYGAGGGGGSYSFWGGTNYGGSGGYPYVIVGY